MNVSEIQDYVPAQRQDKPLWQRVGLPANQGPALLKALQQGLSLTVMDKVATEVNISQAFLLKQAGISARNIARRRASGKLNPEESERIARYVRVLGAATELMGGDMAEAIAWMSEPAINLNGKPPMDLISTETGALEVMQLIGRIRHGVFS